MRHRHHRFAHLFLSVAIPFLFFGCGQARQKATTKTNVQGVTWFNTTNGKPADTSMNYQTPVYTTHWEVPDVDVPSGYIAGPRDLRDPVLSADSTRCEQYGDSLPSDKALERREWARKCHYISEDQYTIMKATADKAGKLVGAYPTFGIFSRDGKAYSNPANYIAPTKKEDSCDDFPEGYAHVIDCWAEGWKAVNW